VSDIFTVHVRLSPGYRTALLWWCALDKNDFCSEHFPFLIFRSCLVSLEHFGRHSSTMIRVADPWEQLTSSMREGLMLFGQ